jgi:anti-sigma-K factor RskA
MSHDTFRDDEREQRLAGKTLRDLDRDEDLELENSLTAAEKESLDEFERTVIALDLAMDQAREREMPTVLRASILREADAFFTGQSSNSAATNKSTTAITPPSSLQVSPSKSDSNLRRREVLAWLTSAAATTIAVGSWWWQTSQQKSLSKVGLSRAELFASAKDLIQVNWKEGKTPLQQAVSGDVVWSSSYQLGFMRLIGMPINDPLQEQYQLWIIDPLRDDEPVDGGVFDIAQSGEVIVPIQAKLHVTKPAAFAITIEKPGGVVVSTQERLPLLAVVP